MGATADAFKAGVKTYVIAVSDALDPENQQQIANAGVGQEPDSGTAPYYRATTQADLAKSFEAVVTAERSCVMGFEGIITPGDESKGTATLDGTPLVYGDPDGWTVMDPHTIEVTGTACAKLKAEPSAALVVSYPCNTTAIYPK